MRTMRANVLVVPEVAAELPSAPTPRERIERVVHEAMLTMRLLTDRESTAHSRSCWPEYVYEREDYGDRPALGELRNLIPPWRPTARHIDDVDWVFLDCYGKWPNPRSRRNGLEDWQWLLLELRAWQVTCGLRGGWRLIAETIRSRPRMPRFSHEWARIEHDRLIEIAVERAQLTGRA